MCDKKDGRISRNDKTPCNEMFKDDSEYCSMAIDKQCFASISEVAETIGFPVFNAKRL